MMNWKHFAVLQAIFVLVVVGLIVKHEDKVQLVKTPPKDIAQWYKPESKRHVWLHNMFKLRREMQAIKLYAENKHQENLEKWASGLELHYQKIAEMVPDWEVKLDYASMARLQAHVRKGQYSEVLNEIDTLQETCDSCHQDYQTITALMYRAPDFSNIEVSPQGSFNQHMHTLTQQVNQIKIASDDGMTELALSSLTELKTGMQKLGQVCTDCHKKDHKPYPSEPMQKTLASLEQHLVNGTRKQQAMDLGMLAVQACATCHGTHRLAFDSKILLQQEQTWRKVLQH